MKSIQQHIGGLLILFFLFTGSEIVAENLIIEGQYQGKDMYVQNPINLNGVGYSVSKVIVNDQVTSDEINSSAFIIDLSIYNYSIGEAIVIQIIHQKNNTPLILNPESLKPISSFEIDEITLNNKGQLRWTTHNENGSLPFIIEQFRWNKWVNIGEVQGIGTPEENEYRFHVDLNTGKNKVRILQKDHTAIPRRSEMVTVYKDSFAPVRFIYNEPKDVIVFNENTRYEIFDEYGVLMKKGFGSKVDVSYLKKGSYFVNFDNVYDTIAIQ